MHQLENGYTKIAHTLLESFSQVDIPSSSFRVIFWVIRNSYGYNKKHTNPTSVRKLAKEVSMSNATVHAAIQLLIEKGIIKRTDKNELVFLKNGVQKTGQSVQKTGQSVQKTGQSVQKTGQSLDSIKETLKDNSKGVPHQDILNLYHTILPELPKVREWTDTRKKYLKARWESDEKRQSLVWWTSFFNAVKASDFLCGRKTTFLADLEWLVRPNNFVKVIEGRYKNREIQRELTQGEKEIAFYKKQGVI